jgi:hypothetical protein
MKIGDEQVKSCIVAASSRDFNNNTSFFLSCRNSISLLAAVKTSKIHTSIRKLARMYDLQVYYHIFHSIEKAEADGAWISAVAPQSTTFPHAKLGNRIRTVFFLPLF